MARRKTRNQSLFIISSATILTLALLVGTFFFLLPKITAASANHSKMTTAQTKSAAHTINATTKTGNVNHVAAQPTRTVSTTTKTSSQSTSTQSTSMSNNTKPAPIPAANNGNQAPAAPTAMPSAQNLTVPLVMLKQYVPDIRHMVAQSFNITDVALAQDLQSGMHLTNIAMQHGVSNAQLQTLLSSSITTGFQPAISTGTLTQEQIASFIQQTRQNPTTLEQQLSIIPPEAAHW